MNILYLCHRIPYPPNKGDKIRSFNEIRYLSKEHDVYLACLVDDSADLSHLPALEKHVKAVDYATINPRWQKMKTIPYLLTSKPLTVPYFYSTNLQEAIDSRLEQQDIDVIFCFSSSMAEYVFKSRHNGTARLKNIRLVMDFVDVDSDKWRMYAQSCGFPLSALYSNEWRCLQGYEVKVAAAFHHSIFVSDKEVELFRRYGSAARLAVVQNGVNVEQFSSIPQRISPDARYAPAFIFTGAMDYYPNEDAVLYFSREIFPLIKQKLPNAIFYIVGSKPRKCVLQLASDANIVVTGFVQDIAPYLAMTDVFVAPLRIARGVQNKVLEAMAAGIPVVASPEAVQGISGHGGSIMVASTAAEFAAHAIEMATQPEKKRLTVEAAKQCIFEQFNWDTNLSRLGKIVAGDTQEQNRYENSPRP